MKRNKEQSDEIPQSGTGDRRPETGDGRPETGAKRSDAIPRFARRS
ncbi:MAG: hypothetical protein JXN62_00610 [Bacteroidales bacterium]|nr:hypothetical protein [Bacteroidales bacterium]